jgi:hypothetical protein
LTVAGAGDEEQRERTAVYDEWWRCETLEDVEEQEALVDRYAERHPAWWTGPTRPQPASC